MIKNLFFFSHLGFGGTEQFLYEVVKKYSKNFHIVVAYGEGSVKQAHRMAKYVDVIKWNPGIKIECERAFLNFGMDIIDDLICDDIYFINHANVEIVGKPQLSPRIKKTINVSNFAQEIYKRHYGNPCEVSYNPISIEDYKKPLILMSAFRGNDPVKGTKRVKQLVDAMDLYCLNNDERYLFFIFSQTLCIPIESPNVVLLEPRTDVRAFMQLADWGVTLSDDMETYCYTNVEFLLYGKPILTTPLSVCEELNMDSSMRLVLNYDMSNVNEIVPQLFKKKMNINYSPPKDRWNELLKQGQGKTKENLIMKFYKVQANEVSFNRGIHLAELGRPAKPGEIFETTEDRLDNLVNGKNRFNVPFAKIVEEPKEEIKEEKVEVKEEPKPKKEEPKKRGRKAKK